MLVGKPPFEGEPGETMSLLEAVIKGDAPKVGTMAPHLPPDVARLIQRLLAKAPSQRPASARELVVALRKLEDEAADAVATPPTTPSPERTRSLMRRPGLLGIAIGAAAIFVSLVLGAVAAYYGLQPHPNGKNGKNGDPGPPPEPIKLGLLHSENGPLSFHEKPMIDATQFAVAEVNAAGGVMGRPIEVLQRDGAGREEIFAEKARELLEKEKVDVLFGCWSAASRKRVEKVCEKHNKFLFFCTSYEGLEDSPAVVYLGGTPNQTLIPLVRWAYTDLRKRRFMLLGTEEIYSRAVNEVIKHELEALGAAAVVERYLLVGDDEFSGVVNEVAEKKIDFIVNTIDGTANKFLLKALRDKGLKPPAVTTAWAALSESELSQFQVERLVGDYTAGTYFESIDLPQNRDFVKRFKTRFRTARVNDSMETAYFGVHLWKQAVEKAGTTETEAVRQALSGMSVEAPEGTIRLADSRHAYRTARVGKITLEGTGPHFEIVYTTPRTIAPDPFPEWRTRPEWQAFVDGLYKQWGGRWEKDR
jgi:urea transport system substrate-binding protein